MPLLLLLLLLLWLLLLLLLLVSGHSWPRPEAAAWAAVPGLLLVALAVAGAAPGLLLVPQAQPQLLWCGGSSSLLLLRLLPALQLLLRLLLEGDAQRAALRGVAELVTGAAGRGCA